MKMELLDRLIYEAAYVLLKEENDDDKKTDDKKAADKKATSKKKDKLGETHGSSKISATGAFGRGGWSKEMKLVETRAVNDPDGLMKDLGIGAASGNTDVQKVYSVLSQAVSKNDIMKTAFSAPKQKKIKEGDKDVIVVQVAPTGDVSYRNGAKYLYLTLLAAENAGVLGVEKGISFAPKK